VRNVLRFCHRSSLYQAAGWRRRSRSIARVLEAIKSGDEALVQRTMREHVLFGGRCSPI